MLLCFILNVKEHFKNKLISVSEFYPLDIFNTFTARTTPLLLPLPASYTTLRLKINIGFIKIMSKMIKE
jgi:hypothetical protein